MYDFDRFSRNDLIGQVVLKGVADHCHPDIETDFLMDILNTRHVSIYLGENVGCRCRCVWECLCVDRGLKVVRVCVCLLKGVEMCKTMVLKEVC